MPVPDSPLLLAGAIGGPFVIGSLTPLRNACTLAAHDKSSTVGQLYRRVFSAGVRSGWAGATTPACAATVQFTVLGPGYHLFLGLLGSPAAALAAGAVTESLITYAPTVRNAQVIHNRVATAGNQVQMQRFRPVGVGFGPLVTRNFVANAGIRVLSSPLSRAFDWALGYDQGAATVSGKSRVAGDFTASLLCGAMSMPLNQLFQFQVTSAACLAAGPAERVRLGLSFLQSQYLYTREDGSRRLSRLVLRDGALRSCYIGCLFSVYAAVERIAVHYAGH